MSDGRDHRGRTGGRVKEPRSVVIAGAGLAAARCAETLRSLGFDGRIVLIGDEPVPPYERPALSKEFLLGKRSAKELLLRPNDFWEEQRIELLLGRSVVAVDAELVLTSSGDVIDCDACVVATGARPRSFPWAVAPGVHTLRTLADARFLKAELLPGRRIALIGGGFIGAEVASTATALGVDVVMLEASASPLERVFGPTVSRLLAERYRAHGVDLRTETSAAGLLSRDGRLRGIALTNGTSVDCDTALVAIGVEPVRDLLNGTPLMRACGDAKSGAGHWTAAASDAVEIAHELLGLDAPARQPPFFWSDQV